MSSSESVARAHSHTLSLTLTRAPCLSVYIVKLTNGKLCPPNHNSAPLITCKKKAASLHHSCRDGPRRRPRRAATCLRARFQTFGPHRVPAVCSLPYQSLGCLIVKAMCVSKEIESICPRFIGTESIRLSFYESCSPSRKNPRVPLHAPFDAFQHLDHRKQNPLTI